MVFIKAYIQCWYYDNGHIFLVHCQEKDVFGKWKDHFFCIDLNEDKYALNETLQLPLHL